MAASGSRPSAPSLAALPDDLLLACFEQMDDPLERCAAPIARRKLPRGSRGVELAAAARRLCHRSLLALPCCRRRLLQLVCSRWRRLADAPQLVRHFWLEVDGVGSLPRLAAFRGWLEQSAAGAAVRSLRLDASPYVDDEEEHYSTSDLALLRSELLRTVAAGSSLQQLTIETTQLPLPDIDVSSLAAALPSLRLLSLDFSDTVLLVEEPLNFLSELLDLQLHGEPVSLDPELTLPPSLTRLVLGAFFEEEFPSQVGLLRAHACLLLTFCSCLSLPSAVSALCATPFAPVPQITLLTQLEQLCFESDCAPARFGPLSHLRSLTYLQLVYCSQ